MTPAPWTDALDLMNSARGRWEVGDVDALLAWTAYHTNRPVERPRLELHDVGGGPMPSTKIGVLVGHVGRDNEMRNVLLTRVRLAHYRTALYQSSTSGPE